MPPVERDVIAFLIDRGSDPLSGVHLHPPATRESIEWMQEASARDLGSPVPNGYVRLLCITDGVQINGAHFKSAEDLVPENLDVHHPGVIVLGNDGNNAWFVFDTRDARFHTVNFGFPDERFASFDSFDAMLRDVMREQGVE